MLFISYLTLALSYRYVSCLTSANSSVKLFMPGVKPAEVIKNFFLNLNQLMFRIYRKNSTRVMRLNHRNRDMLVKFPLVDQRTYLLSNFLLIQSNSYQQPVQFGFTTCFCTVVRLRERNLAKFGRYIQTFNEIIM